MAEDIGYVTRKTRGKLTVTSPILVPMNRKKLVPMTGDFMRGMDKIYAPRLGWQKATLHRRRRGFATAAVKSVIHMANITIAMRHSQGVNLQYVSLSIEENEIITTRLAIAAYKGEPKGGKSTLSMQEGEDNSADDRSIYDGEG